MTNHVVIKLSSNQAAALQLAVISGALHSRFELLREQLKYNHDHPSIGCAIEREIQDLELAAASVVGATEEPS
jgi:hypothetical protein